MSDLQDDPTLNETDDGEELTAEQLKEEIAKKEQDIQYLKGKWGQERSELQQQFQALQQQQAEVNGRISEQREMMSQNKPKAKDPYELDEDTATKFRDDPVEMVKFFKEREGDLRKGQAELVDTILEALKERDGLYAQEFSGLKKELDPNIRAWKPAIDELRQNEKFSKLDEETLIEIAKAKNLKPSMEYRGEAGGQRNRESGEVKEQPWTPDSLEGKLILGMVGGNEEAAKRVWANKEARKGLK